MTNDIVSDNQESNLMFSYNYASNGLNTSNMFYQTNDASVLDNKANSSIYTEHLNGYSNNGILNKIMPSYYEKVSLEFLEWIMNYLYFLGFPSWGFFFKIMKLKRINILKIQACLNSGSDKNWFETGALLRLKNM